MQSNSNPSRERVQASTISTQKPVGIQPTPPPVPALVQPSLERAIIVNSVPVCTGTYISFGRPAASAAAVYSAASSGENSRHTTPRRGGGGGGGPARRWQRSHSRAGPAPPSASCSHVTVTAQRWQCGMFASIPGCDRTTIARIAEHERLRTIRMD